MTAPLDDRATEPPADPSPAPGNLLLFMVIALHLIADLLIGLAFDLDNDQYRTGLLVGVLFGQVTLLAVWTAWAPATFFLRLAGGMMLIGAVAVALAGLILRGGAGHIQAIVFGAILYAQWIASQMPLWMARVFFKQRIVSPTEPAPRAPYREHQFGVGQLLILTACVAAMFGLARWFLTPQLIEEFRGGLMGPSLAWVFVLFAGFNTLAPLPAIWAALSRRWAIWLVLAAVYMAGVAFAEARSFEAVLGPGPVGLFAWLSVSMFITVAGTLLAVRARGYRLAMGR
jgi:hypothetical protein